MHLFTFLTSIFTIFLLHIRTSLSLQWDGNVLHDLDSTNYQTFFADAEDWFLSSEGPWKVTLCGPAILLGGYGSLGGNGGTSAANPYQGQYFQRIYTSLPSHNQIFLQMRFYALDSWDGLCNTDTFTIEIDGAVVQGYCLYAWAPGASQMCGIVSAVFDDIAFTIYLAYPHSSSSLDLKIRNLSDEDSLNESFGFQDIKIAFVSMALPYFSLCQIGYSFSSPNCLASCYNSENVPTPSNSGFCYPSYCDPNCKICSETSTTCTACNSGSYLVGTICYLGCDEPLTISVLGGVASCSTPCPGQFAWWDESCSSECSYTTSYGPLAIKGVFVNTFLQCKYSCSTSQYLYWNSSCLDSCPSPLTTTIYKDRNFCEFSCAETQFLYWNGSCLGTCPEPLSSEIGGDRKFCRYGCSETQYLYWNGSCSEKCDFPLISETQDGRKFCWYRCFETQYLYWNGSCFNNCPSPLTPETQQGMSSSRKFCWYGCSEIQYLYWNGSCIDKCDLPLMLEVQGTDKSRKFCWYPCSETQYLYWNGSCLGTCPSPLTPETQQGTSSNRKFCWYGCQPDKYLYWNGSCIDKCDSPLDSEIQGTFESRNFCWSPCQYDQYIYWNRSCSSECPSPLVKKIDPQIKLCGNPCEDPSSNYLYSNQSCLPTCPNPLSVLNNPGVQYCVSLCPSGTYLYENQTCLSVCSSPYLKRTEPADIQYCERPCSQPDIYWYKNASCLPKCEAPYVQFNYSGIIQCLPPCEEDSEYFNDYEKKCYSTCESPDKIELFDVIKVCKTVVSLPQNEVKKVKETAASIEAQGKFTSGGMKAASAINSNSPSSALLAGLSSMMQYIRYMKISYPPKVQMLFLVSADAPISLGFDFDIPSFIEEHLIDEPLPDAFDKYNINSNFLSNLWDFLVSLVLVLMAILVLAIVKITTSGFPRFHAVVTRILQVLKWNFPIMMVCGSSGDIFFYASLQLRSSPFTSLSSTICCVISILMMILVVFLLAIAFKIAHSLRRGSAPGSWKGFEILYSEYEDGSFFSLAYMLVFISRGIIFNLTLATLFDYPMVQCGIINTCNIAMICYIFYLRPLKDLLSLVQLWINEGLVNTLSVSILILGVLDHMGVNREATRVGIGNVILFAIKTFNTAGLVFMGIGMLVFVISMFRTLKTLREKNIKSPVRMLKALIFGVPESENVNPAGQEEFAKKPKIIKPLRKENNWTREENSSVIEMKEEKSFSHLVSDNSHQILPTNVLQTEWKDEQVSRELDTSQSFFNPQKRISEKNGSLMRGCKVRVQGRNDVLESSKEEVEKRSDEDEMKFWYSKLRKLKRRLNKSSKKIDLTIETNHSSIL